MKKTDVLNKLTIIFRELFSNDLLVLTNEMNANDITHWDSLSHMILITKIEEVFSIKFKLKELNKMKNIEEITSTILRKL